MVSMNRLKYHHFLLYLIPGMLLWYTIHHMGVHATLAGVLLAFTLPAGNKEGKVSLMERLEHILHKPVNYIIMPLFALANTCIVLDHDSSVEMPVHLMAGIAAGLCIGKPLGILLFSYLSVKMKWADLPRGIDWLDMAGAGLLGGIGFTMSVFITLLAFEQPEMIKLAKITIVLASLIAGLAGFLWLKISLRKVT
jgi:NhaA family Na+:H+ antiporter